MAASAAAGEVVKQVDVAVIGSGFGGIYALYKMHHELGLTVQGFDDAGGVGGTWYWNRYPGARSDTEVTAYCYSFDRELFEEWEWTMRYPRQPEILAYLNHVADKYDLKRLIEFNTRVTAMKWLEDENLWELTTNAGDIYKAQFVIEGVGLLSATLYPGFPGEEKFKGQIFHTARWPHEEVDLDGKRVGIVGTGSSGCQVVVDLCQRVGEMYVFMRTPQFNVPAANRPIDAAHRQWILDNWDEYWNEVILGSVTAFGFPESDVSALSVSPEERQRVFDDAWEQGNGFRFMFATFNDIAVEPESNKAATDYLSAKIRSAVKDPETAEKLIPDTYWARRPLCNDGYFEAYNQPNVHLVDVGENDIVEVTEKGLKTADGQEYELDVIIYATGFDSTSGQYLKIDQEGRNGRKLADHWKDRPRSYLGTMVSGFPNMFMIYGPMGPFTNQPPLHEAQVNWMADVIKYVRDNDLGFVDPTAEAEDKWMVDCDDIAFGTLFMKVNSWINGANVEGKPVTNYFYMGGTKTYMELITAETDQQLPGFEKGSQLSRA